MMTPFPNDKDGYGALLVKFAALMFTLSVVGLVVLMVVGKPTAALERLVTPLITAVIVTGVLGIAQAGRTGNGYEGKHRRRDGDED